MSSVSCAAGTSCDYTHDLSPTCPGVGCTGQDVVFYFIVESSGTVDVDTCSETTDTLVSYRDACTTDDSDLACDNDWCAGLGGSMLSHAFSPGVYFYIHDGHCSECGPYSLNVIGL